MASQTSPQRECERDEVRAARRERERVLQVAAVEALRSSAGWHRWLRTRRLFRRLVVKRAAAVTRTAT